MLLVMNRRYSIFQINFCLLGWARTKAMHKKIIWSLFDIDAVLLGITYVHLILTNVSQTSIYLVWVIIFQRPIFINHDLPFSSLQVYKLDQIRCKLNPPHVLEFKFVNGIQHKNLTRGKTLLIEDDQKLSNSVPYAALLINCHEN